MEKSANYKKNQSGFSLIELFLAISILTIGIVGVIAMFPLATKIGKSSEMSTVASELAQEKIEEMISKSYTDIAVGPVEPEHALDPPFSAYLRKTQVEYYNPQTSATTTSDLGVKQIHVTVKWGITLGGTVSKIDIFTLVTRK